ncbi:MAG: alpha/beta fold hydrolase [Mogibacterium sp.]|nr:alpha/beta fold hydrolase [Mogibacterium sp.]
MKEFYIDDDGIKLHAKLDMPDGYEEGSKCPLVIVIHGLTGHMEERHITAIARTLNEMGFATLRAEMYGHGKSGGTFENHNLFKWLNNAMTVTDYAKSLDFVTDLFVAGHSQGGVTTIMLGGMKPDTFKAILPLSPAVMITEGARTGNALRFRFDPDHIPDYLPVADGMRVNGNYIRAAQMLDVDEAIRKYKGPVLIVHGDEDEAIPVRYAIDAAGKYSDAELVIIPGDDHCYNYHLDKVLEAVRSFMSNYITN